MTSETSGVSTSKRWFTTPPQGSPRPSSRVALATTPLSPPQVDLVLAPPSLPPPSGWMGCENMAKVRRRVLSDRIEQGGRGLSSCWFAPGLTIYLLCRPVFWLADSTPAFGISSPTPIPFLNQSYDTPHGFIFILVYTVKFYLVQCHPNKLLIKLQSAKGRLETGTGT